MTEARGKERCRLTTEHERWSRLRNGILSERRGAKDILTTSVDGIEHTYTETHSFCF